VTQMHTIQQHKITETKVQGQKVREQGSNLIFFVVFPVDVGTMNNSQTKGIKLTDQPVI
jgi:hypothetical protein